MGYIIRKLILLMVLSFVLVSVVGCADSNVSTDGPLNMPSVTTEQTEVITSITSSKTNDSTYSYIDWSIIERDNWNVGVELHELKVVEKGGRRLINFSLNTFDYDNVGFYSDWSDFKFEIFDENDGWVEIRPFNTIPQSEEWGRQIPASWRDYSSARRILGFYDNDNLVQVGTACRATIRVENHFYSENFYWHYFSTEFVIDESMVQIEE